MFFLSGQGEWNLYFFKVVYLVSRLILRLCQGIVLILPCMTVLAQPALSPPAPEILVFLEFEDRVTDPQAIRRLTFGIRPNGEFHIGFKRIDASGTPIEQKEIDGHLETSELEQLKVTLPTLEISNSEGEKMNIGYGTDLSRGWSGVLSVTRGGMNQSVEFTSLRPASHPTRSVAINRLVTFIFDLKNLSLGKLGRATRQ